MKMFLLMVLFSNPAEPAPHDSPGYKPRQQPTMERCLERRSSLQNYFDKYSAPDIEISVFCIEFQALGYDEAVDAFNRSLGNPL